MHNQLSNPAIRTGRYRCVTGCDIIIVITGCFSRSQFRVLAERVQLFPRLVGMIAVLGPPAAGFTKKNGNALLGVECQRRRRDVTVAHPVLNSASKLFWLAFPFHMTLTFASLLTAADGDCVLLSSSVCQLVYLAIDSQRFPWTRPRTRRKKQAFATPHRPSQDRLDYRRVTAHARVWLSCLVQPDAQRFTMV